MVAALSVEIVVDGRFYGLFVLIGQAVPAGQRDLYVYIVLGRPVKRLPFSTPLSRCPVLLP